ncbi:MAG TPA: hypothetical protein VLU46_07645 [Thermoanaerobaculia bacterium]|nr:hypothetical protein [Thermoanaerobaculia bacterium]
MSRDTTLKLATAVVALTLLASPWRRELFVGDETKYAQVVREMRGGAFFLPTLDGTPFTHKPPLHFWLIDLLTVPLGVYSMWPFVLPSIAGFAVLLWFMWRMEGWLAAFVCGASLLVWGSAQTARMDVTFTAAMVVAVWMLMRERPIAAGVWAGIAVLIKGLMAPVVILLCAFAPRSGEKVAEGRMRGYIPGLLCMLAIPLTWFIPAMIRGGHTYTHDVLVKQTAERAVGAWVHRSPPWFYILHAPADLVPWFFITVVAIVAAFKRNDGRAKFYVWWILAVIVPYSLLSSKLDVYMMAMIPPAALLVARLAAVDDVWTRRGNVANVAMSALLLLIGIAGLFVKEVQPYRATFVALAIAAVIALVVSRGVIASTIALGLVPIAAVLFAIVTMMPTINELASGRPIVRAIAAQHVRAHDVALYSSPYLWTRDMPRDFEHVRYVSPEELRVHPATVVVTARKHADEIAAVLGAYRKVDQFRMIGKWFDVYRR